MESGSEGIMSAHLNAKTTEAKPMMEVAILYEDWGTGLRAKQACDHLAQRVPAEVGFCLDLWRFDLLEEEAWRTQALSAAVDSDLLIVSAHGHRALPSALESWLQDWLVRRPNEPTGLVLSLDLGAKGSAAAQQLLAEWASLAQSAQVDLFLHFGDAPQRPPAPALPAPAPLPFSLGDVPSES
jgi:hypothetical protein